jgi:hypothetical protein
LLGHDLVGGVGHEVQGEDHSIGIELFAVVELHALTQLEFKRAIVDLLPAARQIADVFIGLGVTVDQGVPDLGAQIHVTAHDV